MTLWLGGQRECKEEQGGLEERGMCDDGGNVVGRKRGTCHAGDKDGKGEVWREGEIRY